MFFIVPFSPPPKPFSPFTTLRLSKCLASSGEAYFLVSYRAGFNPKSRNTSLLSLVLPLVSGLVLEIPKNPTTGGSVTIHWTNEQGDPYVSSLLFFQRSRRLIKLTCPPSSTWSFELINTAFNDAFAIANNVDPSPSQLTLTLPIIPVGCVFLHVKVHCCGSLC